MSYCRWSSDGFRCDVYAYQSVHGGWSIYVAGRKRIIPDGLNPPSVVDLAGDRITVDEYANAQKIWSDAYEALPWVDLTAPSAGQSFSEPTLEDFRERMQALRTEGLRFPDHVFEEIEDEIREAAK